MMMTSPPLADGALTISIPRNFVDGLNRYVLLLPKVAPKTCFLSLSILSYNVFPQAHPSCPTSLYHSRSAGGYSWWCMPRLGHWPLIRTKPGGSDKAVLISAQVAFHNDNTSCSFILRRTTMVVMTLGIAVTGQTHNMPWVY